MEHRDDLHEPSAEEGVGIDDDSFAAKPTAFATAMMVSTSVDPSRPSTSASIQMKVGSDDGEPLGEVLIVSGGSGYNDLVGATPGATYVMPISDDGGSSSEIIRVLGGPSIGDLRSRLVRMIPTSTSFRGTTPPPLSNDALHAFLSYRLPVEGRSRDIKQEWMDILEGRHRLWRGIEAERKECIRGFLVHFESEILRRVHRNFDFRGGSIGNFFLAAAQKFFRSIQSAIFLFSAVALIPSISTSVHGGGRVLPVINTNHTATIGAALEDGRMIVGQCDISHPAVTATANKTKHERANTDFAARLGLAQASGVQTPASVISDPFQSVGKQGVRLTVGNVGDGLEPGSESELDEHEDEEDEEDVKEMKGWKRTAAAAEAVSSRKKPKRSSNLVFSKDNHLASPAMNGQRDGGAEEQHPIDSLGSRIDRLFYVNAYGNEVDPAPNPEYLASLHRCRMLVYSCGSLWTSIVPCLALRGVATAISSSTSLRHKVLLLNTTADRETQGLTAIDFVRVLARSMQHSDSLQDLPLRQVVTHLVYSTRGDIPIDVQESEALGIRCVPIELPPGKFRFDETSVRDALMTIASEKM